MVKCKGECGATLQNVRYISQYKRRQECKKFISIIIIIIAIIVIIIIIIIIITIILFYRVIRIAAKSITHASSSNLQYLCSAFDQHSFNI